MAKRKFARLGDLNGVSISELQNIKNCGELTFAEITGLIEKVVAGEFKTVTDAKVAWSPAQLARFLDALILELPARDAEILELRFSGEAETLPTLEEVGAKYGLTRERIRQILDKIMAQLRTAGSRRLGAWLLQAEKRCLKLVCPLTPALFEQWMGGKTGRLRFSPAFYARLICELNPAIPAWDGSQVPPARQYREGVVEAGLLSLLLEQHRPLALAGAFSLARTKWRKLDVAEFLVSLRRADKLRVEFHRPDRPTVQGSRLLAAEMARLILEASDAPLTPGQILSRARAAFGEVNASFNPRTLCCLFGKGNGFYLLGRSTYGLEKHFALPQAMRARAKADIAALLAREKRPVSTLDMIQNQRFDWIRKTNSHELACLLRGDGRFVDLGKSLFSLAEWGNQVRENVKDLIPRVLAQAGRPLMRNEILERLQQLRSVSASSMPGHLGQHPQVREFGSGFFGLKSWGEPVPPRVPAANTRLSAPGNPALPSQPGASLKIPHLP